ncbi:MAG: MipA/OmpV family protein, partial [Syntrophobacterales bacterium CG03_land_8_20_14_0_80_58_14]
IIGAFVSLDFLQGAAFEGSPLVKNKYAVMTGITVSWVFLKSSKMVE